MIIKRIIHTHGIKLRKPQWTAKEKSAGRGQGDGPWTDHHVFPKVPPFSTPEGIRRPGSHKPMLDLWP